MGKRPINTTLKIENEKVKQNTFCKRKKGFIKKAIELSLLCEQQIYISIYDKNRKRLVEFQSHSEYTLL